MTDRTAATSRVYFDGKASRYREATARGLWRWQRRREARAVLALSGDVAGQTVLDLGCGAGFYAELMAAGNARQVVAVDASPLMLAQINDSRIQTIAGDAATVSLPQRFACVILAGLLEFVADAAVVLRNARRHLAADGRIVVLVPPENGAGRLYQRFHRGHGLDISLFGQRHIDEIAAAAGLRRTASRAAWPLARAYRLENR